MYQLIYKNKYISPLRSEKQRKASAWRDANAVLSTLSTYVLEINYLTVSLILNVAILFTSEVFSLEVFLRKLYYYYKKNMIQTQMKYSINVNNIWRNSTNMTAVCTERRVSQASQQFGSVIALRISCFSGSVPVPTLAGVSCLTRFVSRSRQLLSHVHAGDALSPPHSAEGDAYDRRGRL